MHQLIWQYFFREPAQYIVEQAHLAVVKTVTMQARAELKRHRANLLVHDLAQLPPRDR